MDDSHYHSILYLAVHRAMSCRKKILANVAVPSAPVWVPRQRSLAPSDTSVG